MARDDFSFSPDDVIAETAARWLARRDRGLSPAEQDAYLQWLQSDPRHRAAVVQLARAWGRIDALVEWCPDHAARPNPDLLASPRPGPWRRAGRTIAVALLATAASVTAGFLLWPRTADPAAVVRLVPGPERLTLEDGSRVELNAGARVETQFTSKGRGVALLAGEAHFVVAKNPARPFVVQAGGVAVRAVGTAFTVQLERDAVGVLVTEGSVSIERPGLPATPLTAGQRATIASSSAARVVELNPAELEQALAWQGARLEFSGQPLAEVVAEFNRFNRRQLVIGDAEAGAIRVGGRFRADNVEAFVRLIEATFGVVAEPREDGALVLRRGR